MGQFVVLFNEFSSDKSSVNLSTSGSVGILGNTVVWAVFKSDLESGKGVVNAVWKLENLTEKSSNEKTGGFCNLGTLTFGLFAGTFLVVAFALLTFCKIQNKITK